MTQPKRAASLAPETITAQAMGHKDDATGALVPPVHLSTTFEREPDGGLRSGRSYIRPNNPTNDAPETLLATLEQGAECLLFSSGMAAATAVFQSLKPGDHVIAPRVMYWGLRGWLNEFAVPWGLEVEFIDGADLNALARAVRPGGTRMVWLETPANPTWDVTDIAAAAAIAHEAGALLAVDSTVSTPVLTQPLTLGADLVMHSLTKYLGGHGDAMGGSVCGKQSLIGSLRGEALVHYGGVISPFNAWLILRGMATLPIRMRSHEENALKVAHFLEHHPGVEKVFYPGLASHPQHQLATRQMDNFSGMISFRTPRPNQIAQRMMQKLEVIHYAVSLGHHRSLIYLMQTGDLIDSSYRLDGEELEKYRDSAGEGIFRLSVGLEDAGDLIADLEQVL